MDEPDALSRDIGFAEVLRICHFESDNIVNIVSIRCCPASRFLVSILAQLKIQLLFLTIRTAGLVC
jgi:hypothetical protein